MCEFCCKPWWRFMCIGASVEAVTGFNRLIWLVSFCSCIFLWVLCQGLLVLIGASIFFRGTWMCLLICTSEDTKTGVNWTRTIFINLFYAISLLCIIAWYCMLARERWLILTTNCTFVRSFHSITSFYIEANSVCFRIYFYSLAWQWDVL